MKIFDRDFSRIFYFITCYFHNVSLDGW